MTGEVFLTWWLQSILSTYLPGGEEKADSHTHQNGLKTSQNIPKDWVLELNIPKLKFRQQNWW